MKSSDVTAILLMGGVALLLFILYILFYSLAFLLLFLYYYPISWIFVFLIAAYLIYRYIQNKGRTEKKIRAAKKSNVVYIESQKLYAIPLQISASEVIILHPAFLDGSRPSINFKEIKISLSDVSLVNRSPNPDFNVINEISSVAKDLYCNIDPQREDLRIKLTELKRLEKLAEFSELYKRQSNIYSRASQQVEELLDASGRLRSECYNFVMDILIGKELANYDNDNFPDVCMIRMSLDSRCKQASDRYQILKSEMDEYMNLKNEMSQSQAIPSTKSNR